MMLIRIGDERRDLKDDHLNKLKNALLSEDAQSNHKALIIETLNSCILNLPHKSLLYSSLVALIAVVND
jgi:hypothetical protein